MCLFTSPVAAVSDTRIFVRMAGAGRQYLAYEMSFAAVGDTAMVLPLPVASRDEATAVRFIDLSGTPDFFDRIGKSVWMIEERGGDLGDALSAGLSEPVRLPLLVHEVGAFEASFVPSLADFERLDARFRLPPDVWEGLPQYHDYGFAVFKLRATGEQARHAHPMALEFSTRLEGKLFAPTVHVHDGVVEMRAWFDHVVYAQVERWTLDRPVYFENGLQQKGAGQGTAKEQWEMLRLFGGDWRLPRPEKRAHRLGIMLPAKSAHPLRTPGQYVSEQMLTQWRAFSPRSRESILRLRAHAQAHREQCKRFADAIQGAAGATAEERRAMPRIARWMEIASWLKLGSEPVRRWQALGSADRDLALRNKATQGGDAAARAWMELPADLRERFGRIHRWDDVPPLLAAQAEAILQWMERDSDPRREAARRARGKAFFPMFDPVPDPLLRAVDAPDVERDEAIREAVLALEPEADGETARCWRKIEPKFWDEIGQVARLEELSPLFDAAREIHAVGLSGTLPNRDTLIDVS